MKVIINSLTVFFIAFFSCSDKQDPRNYFDDRQRDSLLADIITYIYVRPTGATWETRFNPEFRKFYVTSLPKFKLEKLYRDKSDIYYFFIIRPARSAEGVLRGVGGKFRIDDRGNITSFVEVYNTPVGPITELHKKGTELFNHMVKHGHVDEYLLNDEYLEWPNAWTYYDTIRHEWLVKPGI
ncbi:MAG: hypothetical protein HRU69_05175 [Flammeovirgaceae bacterium]|nr:MAG: hypothetical protein HRU69_05175 [Flammeovirgaceae bacterium]